MPLRTSRESRQGLPRPSSLRGGSGIRGSNTSHCPSVRSMLCFHSCQKDVRQGHYSLASTFMRWLLELAHTLGIDPVEAAKAKLEVNKQKYPIDLVKGKASKY